VSGAAITHRMFAGRAALWLAIAAAVLFVIGAHAHLVYVAVTSQPDCVAHEKPGDSGGQAFSAAQSACSPQAE
jgi:hypothetical protein